MYIVNYLLSSPVFLCASQKQQNKEQKQQKTQQMR